MSFLDTLGKIGSSVMGGIGSVGSAIGSGIGNIFEFGFKGLDKGLDAGFNLFDSGKEYVGTLSALPGISRAIDLIGDGYGSLKSKNIDYQALLQLGGAMIKEKNMPDMPNIDPYTPIPLKRRNLEDMAPYTKFMDQKQANIALRMMSGEIPKDVQDQIRMETGERAIQFGYGDSEQRSRNVVARDLGLTSLDIVQQGMAYSSELRNRAKADMNDRYQLDMIERDMHFDQWASNAQLMMDRYRSTIAARNTYANDLLGGANMFFENQKANSAEEGIEGLLKDSLNAYKDDLITIGKTDTKNTDIDTNTDNYLGIDPKYFGGDIGGPV